MKSILVTGSYGQLGEACIKYLKSNFKLFISDSVIFGNGMQLDITDEKTVDQVLAETNPDIILNLAAMTDVDKCENDPSMARAINVDGVKNLCRGFGGHFIQISTDYVFDGIAGPYYELDETNPISVYGRTKLDADEWLRINHTRATILRTNVLYSYTKLTQASFVKWVVDSLSQGKKINVVDDQWNNPT
ncbi:MAG: SDR family oxidoreductase, partial [Candidatus Neomarinimicrobiota bacterium]|nr:SDR family oxidoreductase [Candidatus Neomarinimicrobiota bacterium]